jgi:predicted nucleic acid-binding protein
MLLDTNLIIYSAKPEHAELRKLIEENAPAVSAVSVVEALGYHKLTAEERAYFEEFFKLATVLPISDEVIERAVQLRQARKMSLGDALIAATALVHDRTLLTHNAKDFAAIPDLKVRDPLES